MNVLKYSEYILDYILSNSLLVHHINFMIIHPEHFADERCTVSYPEIAQVTMILDFRRVTFDNVFKSAFCHCR